MGVGHEVGQVFGVAIGGRVPLGGGGGKVGQRVGRNVAINVGQLVGNKVGHGVGAHCVGT